MYFLRPSWAEINLSHCVHNLEQIKKIVKNKVQILAVVKADAYGHGAIEVSKVVLRNGVSFLGVALIEEGIKLRQAGIDAPILVMGSIYPFKNYRELINFNLIPIVASLSSLKELSSIASKEGEKVGFHLKVDTGMGRIGVSVNSVLKLVKEISSLPGVVLEGIISHLSCADGDGGFTEKQIDDFTSVVEKIKYKKTILRHIANSSAILRFPESHLDLVRPGLILYGLLPFRSTLSKIKLKPVMSLKTKVIFLKKVAKGTPVSYGKTYVTKKRSIIATLPIGYADGYNRLLSNKAQVLIKGKRLPVVGRICMDMCMVDVTDLPQVAVGDEVVLIGNQENETITVEDIAVWSNTVNYETVCALGKRIPRIYIGNA